MTPYEKFRSLIDDVVLLAVVCAEDGEVVEFLGREVSDSIARLTERGLIEGDE